MSSRLPPLPREELRPDRQEFRDYFHATSSAKAPHPGAADRAVKTLFPILAVLPKTGRANVDLLALLEEETAEFVSHAARETVSLVATAFFQSKYIDYIHHKMAVELGYLTQAQADGIAEGVKPKGLSDECSVAYDLAWHLLRVRGPLPDPLWQTGVKQFGEEGTVGLMHYVGLIAWTSMGLNVADVPVPTPNNAAPE